MSAIPTQEDAPTPSEDQAAPFSTRPPPSERLGWGPHDPLGAFHAVAPAPRQAPPPRGPATA